MIFWIKYFYVIQINWSNYITVFSKKLFKVIILYFPQLLSINFIKSYAQFFKWLKLIAFN